MKRLVAIYFLSPFLLIGQAGRTYTKTLVAQVQPNSGFNIYCTSNQDGTGACNRTDNNLPIACLIIPGGVINCKEDQQASIQCVLYSSALNSQAYYYCTRRTDPGIRNNRIRDDRFAPQSTPTSSPVAPIGSPTSPIQNQFSDPLNQ